MDRTIYGHAVSRLKVLETRLLDKTKINRMIDSSSADEALKVLNETEYAHYVSNLKRAEDYEVILSEELDRAYKLMYDVTPNKAIIDVISLKYDYHNIKVLLKGNALKKELDYLLVSVGTVPTELLKKSISEEYYGELSPVMREAIEKTLLVFNADNDPQKIDIILDKYMYTEMLSKALSVEEEYIVDFVKIQIDITNIKTLLRVKKQNKDREFLDEVIIRGGKIDNDIFINSLNDSIENFTNKISHTDYYNILKVSMDESGKKGSINIFEKYSDNFIMNYIKEAKYVSFGPQPILAYIFAKEAEIKAIRTVMVGKLNNIAPEIIRERLRDIYV
ncbi:V-type ATP synthase subunit C [Haloimpatiens sp. FM7330]|uniref:V-type ATP synthase subunit C n=1 Tax=Haloimpatiens sp. FM7330 TaxID=3298610 RepID=UPI0036312403